MSIEPCSVEFFRKSNNLMDPLKFVKKGKICESVHFEICTGNLILEFIEERTDVAWETKQQQLERSKRLYFCIPLLKTVHDL